MQLKHRLTPETPLGGDDPVPARIELFERSLDGEYDDHDDPGPIDLDDPADADEPGPAVDVGPLARAIARAQALTEHLDYHHHDGFTWITIIMKHSTSSIGRST